MVKRTGFEAAVDKRGAVNQAESEGKIADSMDVRTALMTKVHSGEITLQEAQAELARIKRGAKKAGMMTRSQAFDQG